MLRRPFGNSGLQVPALGFGANANVERNVAAVQREPLNTSETAAVAMAFEAHGQSWRGLV